MLALYILVTRAVIMLIGFLQTQRAGIILLTDSRDPQQSVINVAFSLTLTLAPYFAQPALVNGTPVWKIKNIEATTANLSF